LTQHTAQAQEDEHRERQKYDGIDIEHVSHAFGYRGRSPAGFAYERAPSIGPAAVASVVGRINPLDRASRRHSAHFKSLSRTLDDQGAEANIALSEKRR
jgi:hypothetical protein